MNGLSFSDLRFAYDTNEVLRGVTAEIQSGRITSLFGPNGSGKTTLLKCLAGLYKPTSGVVTLDDRTVNEMNPREISRRISYVPQEHSIAFGFTVEEVVLMGRTPHLGGIQGPGEKDYAAAQRAIEAVHIQDIASRPYTNLSGGQRQLVLIARAIAQETQIVIMDEPTSALDFKNQMLVWSQLKELRQSNKTILVCTHDPNHVIWFCDDVIVLQNGVILSKGSVSQIMDKELMTHLYGDICEVENGMVRPTLK